LDEEFQRVQFAPDSVPVVIWELSHCLEKEFLQGFVNLPIAFSSLMPT
jgi:hypothetical protein